MAEERSLWSNLRWLVEGVLLGSDATECDDLSRWENASATVDAEGTTIRLFRTIHHLDDEFACLLVETRLAEVTSLLSRMRNSYLFSIHKERDSHWSDLQTNVVPFVVIDRLMLAAT